MIHNVAQGVQSFTSNAFLVEGERTVLVDAGASFDAVSAIEERVESLDAVVLTHTHPDHVGNLADVVAAFDAPVYGFDTTQDGVERELGDEDTVAMGDHEYVALHTPGHKNDHICLYAADAGVLFAGDLIFQNGSFGRTDLEEGDRDALIRSIDRVADRVDADLQALHPGHGPSIENDPYSHIELSGKMARQA
ncbi:Glyoxylase, beta-lactamase superfamily II [Natronoarchaeum philippinense]|uniref:Glyoxylase, beta-lactamase superfamily II n=1 Tax=Natronoarchaeum philippinense TaxID=558529 RepID=A0A285N2P3_NATPI|nr:MBL fold metallo-hydrolase [Natronoarchaeum philippinense]SNZ03067.1 Glyoxylase, beta-lactamase superfamily II [Natronoarchaeum philippinense]